MRSLIMSKKYIIYLIRWQLSSPILALCLVWLGGLGTVMATVIANLIGGLIFFWVDKFIFKENKMPLTYLTPEEIEALLIVLRHYDDDNDDFQKAKKKLQAAL